MRTPTSREAQPSPEQRAAAKDKGLNDDDTTKEFEKFKRFNLARGTTAADWLAVWELWLERVKPAEKQKLIPGTREWDEERERNLAAQMKAYRERLAREAAA